MKKLISVLLAVLMLASLTVCASADAFTDGDVVELPIPEVGLTLQIPGELYCGEGEAGGIVEVLIAEEVGYKSGVYLTQLIYSPNPDVFEAENYAPYLTFICLRDDCDQAVASDPEIAEMIPGDIYELTTAGRYSHYAAIGTDSYPDGFTQANINEYQSFLELADDIIYYASYGEPEDPYAEAVGNVVSFETTDLDGNSISSADLFARHEITMVNIWETGCGACKGELAELAEINSRLESMDCGIVGLLWDSDSQENIDEAQQLMREAGGNYITLCSPENFDDLFQISGFPTSYFIDRNGQIVGTPICGAMVDKYETAIQELLSGGDTAKGGNTVGARPFSAQAGAMKVGGKAAPAANSGYQVLCLDEDGNPVEGAMIQFCSDEMCQMGKTDEEGIAVFDSAPGHYTVHLLKPPVGYAKDSTEYEAPELGGEVTIVLKAA